MKQGVFSFDIFDTCLVRIWANPIDLFWELGSRLKQEQFTDCSPENWVKLRVNAEKSARALTSHGEITLEEIYQQIENSLGWTKEQSNKILKKEVDLEFESLYALPCVKKIIDEIRVQGGRVVYISDMYLSEEIILQLLIQNNLWRPNDRLYVSSQWKMNKANGTLFYFCLKQEEIEPQLLSHIGDNLSSDVLVPQKIGIRSTFFNQAHLNRYEKKITDHKELSPKFRSLLAGSSRLTRLQAPDLSPDKITIWNTSANVVAPVLFGYAHWCLLEAQRRGIKKLYFVARDGQILQKISQIICENWGYEIDCRYLYGSRQAWHFPAISKIEETELDWILDNTEFLSVYSVCERVNISPKQIENCLQTFGFDESCWNKNLSSERRNDLRQLFSERVVADLIISIAARYRKEAIGYFRQEGLAEKPRFAIVDIGWHGRLQCSLRKLLDSENLTPKYGLIGFYFSLSKRVKASSDEQLLAYFSDPDNSTSRDALCQFRALFELFVTADHGGTMSFKKTDDRYAPVLRYKENVRALNWGLAIQQTAICEFSKYLTNQLDCEDACQQDYLVASEVLLREFIEKPSVKEAEVYGSFEFAEDQAENILYEIAPRYKLADFLRLLSRGKHPHHNVWIAAAKLRSAIGVRWLIDSSILVVARRLKKLGGRVKTSPFNLIK